MGRDASCCSELPLQSVCQVEEDSKALIKNQTHCSWTSVAERERKITLVVLRRALLLVCTFEVIMDMVDRDKVVVTFSQVRASNLNFSRQPRRRERLPTVQRCIHTTYTLFDHRYQPLHAGGKNTPKLSSR